jgi:predicted metal-binding membrane protein
VGCCWLLMLICFGLGVMNLVWMAVLTAFMLVEKITPAGRAVSRVAGAGLVMWGGLMLLS